MNKNGLPSNCEICGETDIGLTRKTNQDSIGYYEDIGLALLADGVGGHFGGQIASKMAIDGMHREINEKIDYIVPERNTKNSNSVDVLLQQAIESTNNDIYQTSVDEELYRGMSTTIVATLLYNHCIHIAHVGDSRAYLFRDGGLIRLTKDHSLNESSAQDGQAKKSRKKQKHILTQAMGAKEEIASSLNKIEAKINDIVLMCSDGVHGVLKDFEIEKIISGYNGDLKVPAEQLIEESKKAGSRDNISVVLTRVSREHHDQPDLFCKIFKLFH